MARPLCDVARVTPGHLPNLSAFRSCYCHSVSAWDFGLLVNFEKAVKTYNNDLALLPSLVQCPVLPIRVSILLCDYEL